MCLNHGSVAAIVSAGQQGGLPRKIKEKRGRPLESIAREERVLYLKEHPTKAKGYYTQDFPTPVGPVENLCVLRVREGDFHPEVFKILPYRRRTSPELFEVVLTFYAGGVSTRSISQSLEGIDSMFYPSRAFSSSSREWRERCALGSSALLHAILRWNVPLGHTREE